TLGLMVTHPRVDHTDPRNCAPLRAGDSIEEIEEKISEYDPDEENCDDGFEVEGAFWGHGPGLGGDDLANVISTGNTATQIAMAADAEPLEIIEEQNTRFVETLREKVAATYQVPIEIVEV